MLMILSGGHSMKDDRDRVNSLDCLSTTDNYSMNETRRFYEDIRRLFGLHLEGDHCRLYDCENGSVAGMNNDTPEKLEWKERAPAYFFGSWLGRLNIDKVQEVIIVNVAAFYHNVEGLREETRKFDPTILAID